ACVVQSLDLSPLLGVFDGRCFEGPAHLVKLAAAVSADDRSIAGRHLKALATLKARMRHKMGGTGRSDFRRGGRTVACIPPECHASAFLRMFHRHLTPELSRAAKRRRLE